jgi:hypothetical protein
VSVPTPAIRRALLLIAVVYVLSSLVAGPVAPGARSAVAHWQLGPIQLGRPIVTWGDPPHYLVVVASLVEDGDLDLRNNYDQARAGDWDVGTRFRGADLDRHVEADGAGRQRSIHSPFLPLLLAAVAWPFRGTEWVESVCIWFTIAVTLWGLGWCARLEGFAPAWLVALGLATPLWVYARDVSTEPYQAAAWSALLVLRHPLAVAGVVIAAVLLKIPFVLVPLALGAVALARGDRRAGLVLVAASVVAIVVAVGAAQWVFRDADHFSLFHIAGHLNPRPATFRPRWDGVVGLLLGPENGLLLFCPFLVLAVPALTKDARLLVPALAFFLFHASYSGWRAGSGVSARYLVPMLPVLVLAVARSRPRGLLVGLLVAYGAVIAAIAGVLPVAAYDKTPWGMIAFLTQRIGALFGVSPLWALAHEPPRTPRA